MHGETAWNGVAILSRVGLDDVTAGLAGGPGFPHQESRALSATCGGIRVVSVYVPNGRQPGSEHYEYKLAWLASLREMVAAGPEATVVCGDMNIAPTDADVFDPDAYIGQTHVTPPERAALAELQCLGLRDVVRDRWPNERVFTYWDYRAGMFHQDLGDADRSRAGQRDGRRPCPGGVGGQAGAQGQRAERSRAGDRRPGRGAGRAASGPSSPRPPLRRPSAARPSCRRHRRGALWPATTPRCSRSPGAVVTDHQPRQGHVPRARARPSSTSCDYYPAVEAEPLLRRDGRPAGAACSGSRTASAARRSSRSACRRTRPTGWRRRSSSTPNGTTVARRWSPPTSPTSCGR